MVRSWLARLGGRRRPRIYLHIGAMKTGTTYLQELMRSNKAELLEAGYLYPGERFSDHSDAVRDVLFSPEDPEVLQRTRGKWNAIVDEMRGYRGRGAILSMEFLSFADATGAARVVDSFPDHEVHVILTVRDAVRAIPAQWQTSTRTGSRVTLRQFVRGARFVRQGEVSPKGRGSHLFQRTQGIPRMLEVWTPLVGPKRVHVITVPPSGSDPSLLWQRFARVIGVDPRVVADLPEVANPSIGHPSSEFLRLLNKELGKVRPVDYSMVVKGRLARRILGSRAAEERPVRLHRAGVTLAQNWNQEVREAIKEYGVRLVGSLDELPVGKPDPSLPKKLYKPTKEELVAAATTAFDGLLDLRDELARDAQLPPPARPDLPDWRTADEPVHAAVTDVASLVRECMELRHRVRDRGADEVS